MGRQLLSDTELKLGTMQKKLLKQQKSAEFDGSCVPCL
jgi:hypothetical protein